MFKYAVVIKVTEKSESSIEMWIESKTPLTETQLEVVAKSKLYIESRSLKEQPCIKY